jgi:hypothetical protein
VNFQPTPTFKKDAVIVLLGEDQIKEKNFSFRHEDLKKKVRELAVRKYFEGKEDQLFPLPYEGTLILLVGAGKKGQSLTALRSTVRKALQSSYLKKAHSVEIIPHSDRDDIIEAIIE